MMIPGALFSESCFNNLRLVCGFLKQKRVLVRKYRLFILNIREDHNSLLFYVIILGFGALAGVIINILINQKNLVYTVIGSIVILLTGAFACFVLYYPFYFDSFRSLIMALIIAAIFFIVIYVALRLIVNTVVSNHEPLTQPDADSRSQMSKQPAHVRSSNIGRIGRVKTKTIENVEVTRINKAVIQSVKTSTLTASKASSSSNVSPIRVANNISAEQAEPTRAAFTSAAVSSEELKAQLHETAVVHTDEEANIAQPLPVQVPEATVNRPMDQEAGRIAEQPVREPESTAVRMDAETVDSVEELVQEPETVGINEAAFIVQDMPFQRYESTAVQMDAEAVDSVEELVQEPETAGINEAAYIVQEMPFQRYEAATQMDAEAVDSVEELVQEPETADINEAAFIVQDMPFQRCEATADQMAAEAVDSAERPVEESEAAIVPTGEEAAYTAELPVHEPQAAAVQTDAEAVDSVEMPVQESEAAAEPQLDEDEVVPNSVQETPSQPNEVSTSEQPISVPDKYSILLDKAIELIGDGKYIYALQLLKVCLSGPSSFTQQKQADIMTLECLILSKQYDHAQKKWLEVLNKMYILESTDKLRLKQLLSLLNNRSKRVS